MFTFYLSEGTRHREEHIKYYKMSGERYLRIRP